MRLLSFGRAGRWVRRRGGDVRGNGSGEVTSANVGLEALEDRLLLSATSLGQLPNLSSEVTLGGVTYSFEMPEFVQDDSAGYTTSFTGRVFNDLDADGWWDPDEHALQNVRVYADVNGDRAFSDHEPSDLTDDRGYFNVHPVPSGDYVFRVEMPDGYRPAYDGSDVKTMTVEGGHAYLGHGFGLVRSGYDLGVAFSDVSMPGKLTTGKRVKLPVIVTNRGDATLPAGAVELRLHVSGDKTLSADDLLLIRKPLRRALAPGESVKLNLRVKLPDALADFKSYLMVQGVDAFVASDINVNNNLDVTEGPAVFKASKKKPALAVDELQVVLGNWDNTQVYGGYAPGYGYGQDGGVGIADLNVILGNWNSGGSLVVRNRPPTIKDVSIEGGYLVHGEPTRITAEGVDDSDGYVRRVVFYYDADKDGRVDDVLGVDSDGTDGYSILAELSGEHLATSGGRVLAVAVDDDMEVGGQHTDVRTRLSLRISAGRQLVYREVNGAAVTVAMTGPGGAQVLMLGEGISAYDLGHAIEVTGKAKIGDILLQDTDVTSALKITSTGSKAVRVTGALRGDAPLGVLSARTVDFKRGIKMTGDGVIRRIHANSIRGVAMPGDAYGQGVKIVAGRVTGEMTIGSPLRLLKVDTLRTSNIQTPWVSRLLVRNDISNGRMTLTGVDSESGLG